MTQAMGEQRVTLTSPYPVPENFAVAEEKSYNKHVEANGKDYGVRYNQPLQVIDEPRLVVEAIIPISRKRPLSSVSSSSVSAPTKEEEATHGVKEEEDKPSAVAGGVVEDIKPPTKELANKPEDTAPPTKKIAAQPSEVSGSADGGGESLQPETCAAAEMNDNEEARDQEAKQEDKEENEQQDKQKDAGCLAKVDLEEGSDNEDGLPVLIPLRRSPSKEKEKAEVEEKKPRAILKARCGEMSKRQSSRGRSRTRSNHRRRSRSRSRGKTMLVGRTRSEPPPDRDLNARVRVA